MIFLIPTEAKTYEWLKQGLTIPEIATLSGFERESVRRHIRRLIELGMVRKSERKNKLYRYETIDLPYTTEQIMRLTVNQAAVYEHVKLGEGTTSEVSKQMGVAYKTASRCLVFLEENKFLKKIRVDGKLAYVALEKAYEFKQPRVIRKGTKEWLKPDLSGFEYELTEQQKKHLQDYWSGKLVMDRTPLSKLTGIPKLYLNFVLDRRMKQVLDKEG